VEDVESAVAALKTRGVVFEEYDLPSLSTVNSIATVGQAKEPGFKIAKAISSRWLSWSRPESRRTPW
jgi:hypothetical protein